MSPGVLAEQRERLKLLGDIKFERDQIGRSPADQQVATTLRQIYGVDYLSHMQDFEAQQIRNNAALKAMRDAAMSSRDGLEKLQLQMDLVGRPAAEQTRALALLDADQSIRRQGLSGTAAELMRSTALATADATTQLERQMAAWKSWRDEAGGAIDSVVGDIATGKLGVDTLTSSAEEAAKWFAQLAIANPLKNSLLGENLPTAGDVWDRITGKKLASDGLASAIASSVATMNVSAATVIVSGRAGSLLGDMAGAANDNLGSRAAGIGSDAVASKITGLNDNFDQKLSNLIAGAKDAGFDISVDSGFRSVERQEQLWQQALKKYGSAEIARKWVAPPGRSMHNYGMAADLGYGSPAARSWAHENASAYGLDYPLGNEPWHIEPAGARSGGIDAVAGSAGRSLQSMSQAADTAAKATTGLGSGLGDLTSAVGKSASEFADLAMKWTGSTAAAGNSNWLSNIIASMTPGAAGWLNANGNAFSGGRIVPFARGGVFDRPIAFPMAGGDVAIGAEAGPEALMPLRRLSNGRLGVEAGFSGGHMMSAPAGGVTRVSILNNGQPITQATQSERVGADGSRELVVELGEAVASELARPGSAPFRAARASRMTVR